MCIFDTSFANLFWLANNKKGKYPEFCMGYSKVANFTRYGKHRKITEIDYKTDNTENRKNTIFETKKQKINS